MPNKEQIIYVAGFFDGDGCITTSPKTNFRVSISNTDKRVLKWLKNNFGGNINNCYLPKNNNHNEAWKWVICRRKDVLKFLSLISKYVIIKKEQVELIAEYLNNYKKNENLVYPDIKRKLKMLKTDKHYNSGGD